MRRSRPSPIRHLASVVFLASLAVVARCGTASAQALPDGVLPPPEVAPPPAPPGAPVPSPPPIPYARAGLIELGGSAGFTAGNGLTQINVAPSVGLFVYDNVQLTGIFDLAYASTELGSGTLVTALLEPSYHLPLTPDIFGFFGVGGGASILDGAGVGVALAPRVGANFLVGRAGVLTPSISWQYNTHDRRTTPMGTMIIVSSAVRFNVGYTIIW